MRVDGSVPIAMRRVISEGTVSGITLRLVWDMRSIAALVNVERLHGAWFCPLAE